MFVMRSCINSLKAKINVCTQDSLMQMPYTNDPIIHRWYLQKTTFKTQKQRHATKPYRQP